MRRTGKAILAVAVVVNTAQPSAAAQTPDAPLRHFTIDKPRDASSEALARTPPPPRGPALEADRLRGHFGMGYVDGADWATDIRANGRVLGFTLDWRSVTTTGARETRIEQQALSISSPLHDWIVEAGDVFSMLSGVGRGVRVSFTAPGGRRPALLVSQARRPFENRSTLITYRDRLNVGRDSFVDGEVATDGSHFVAARTATRWASVETSLRRRRSPSSRDVTLGGSLNLTRQVRLLGSVVESTRDGVTSRWRTAGVGFRFRALDLTFERTITVDGPVEQTSSSLAGNAIFGRTHLFHRQQWGQVNYETSELAFLQGLNHAQSMATFSPTTRLQLTLQMASQWQANGRLSLWEELYAAWRIMPGTTLDLTTVVPRFDRDRLRVRLTQNLPFRFAIELEHGRVSPYQAMTLVDSRPRTRALLLYRFDVAAPPGRADVRGTVVDHLGRPVPGAVVRLGQYAAAAANDGSYSFRNVPPGQYEVTLDETALSADQAWDGRRTRIDTRRRQTEVVTLRVAPLATLTGRAFIDRNGDGVYSPGEEVAGLPIFLDDGRGTTTDRFGLYGFYNLRPGAYRVSLDARSIPPSVRADVTSLVAILESDRPVTGLDFVMRVQQRPVLWSELR